jgi:hypothetical protein
MSELNQLMQVLPIFKVLLVTKLFNTCYYIYIINYKVRGPVLVSWKSRKSRKSRKSWKSWTSWKSSVEVLEVWSLDRSQVPVRGRTTLPHFAAIAAV